MLETAPATPSQNATFRQPAVLAWLRMLRFVSRTQRLSAERLRGWGVSLAQFDVIAQVGADEGMTQGRLAERLLTTQGNVCQLLQGLEKRGLIERRPQGRTKQLFLSAAGRALFHDLVPAHEAWLPERFAALTPDEQGELSRLLRKLERSQR
ncbi:MarR family winged helix-turn-helix transcriptional regulator [Truepera radiovictrix]|jgi:DNA-binding MarR family transcriptional regulator|uniref:Transcriptional regulator, MarR family n=1 Tax=Truepera radiovictrix (strain DSM 17093 / CIP 108686 / LMG 22925 / RQ-24) TaxID=649638 RepID=D7CT42_TRURR|nr:MarR family transcriptional regulator [Truepera radiovictrix]ADI15505.1 transcriptional regulator, MarR family [Truepera radiovictrix DSM 17093]WMT55944.1 MarR family transcriptional regulator [Truepera radiovictrix]